MPERRRERELERVKKKKERNRGNLIIQKLQQIFANFLSIKEGEKKGAAHARQASKGVD